MTQELCELCSEVRTKTLERGQLRVFLLFDFEQVNICWDVIKSLLNDFWLILKMLCSESYSRPPNFYWQNVLMYSFLNKNARDTLTGITY